VRVLAELAHFQWGRLVGAYDDAPRRLAGSERD
jgi:hypothetical protein